MRRALASAIALIAMLATACGGVSPVRPGLIGDWPTPSSIASDGTHVIVFRGFEHCETHDIMQLTVRDGVSERRRYYLRDTKDALRKFSELWAGVGRFEELDSVPAGVLKTGFERAGVTLWLAEDESAAYFEFEDTVERWPASPQSLTDCD